jgi:hypothetical protein
MSIRLIKPGDMYYDQNLDLLFLADNSRVFCFNRHKCTWYVSDLFKINDLMLNKDFITNFKDMK